MFSIIFCYPSALLTETALKQRPKRRLAGRSSFHRVTEKNHRKARQEEIIDNCAN